MKKILKESQIKVKNVGYVRDLGGIPTADGKKIKYGLIYRSSHLGSIQDKGKDIIKNKLHIGQVVDLRSPSELAYQPEQEIENVEYIHNPVLSDTDNPSVNKHTRNDILNNLMAKPGGTKCHLEGIYRKLVSLPEAKQAYHNLFKALIKNDKVTIYHCTQGKDRTGVASALILLALGVDKDVIMQDFLYYNKANRFKNALISVGVTICYFSRKKAKQLSYLMKTVPSYLEAAFDEIIKNFGSFLSFFKDGLSLTDEDLDMLKNKYLESC